MIASVSPPAALTAGKRPTQVSAASNVTSLGVRIFTGHAALRTRPDKLLVPVDLSCPNSRIPARQVRVSDDLRATLALVILDINLGWGSSGLEYTSVVDYAFVDDGLMIDVAPTWASTPVLELWVHLSWL